MKTLTFYQFLYIIEKTSCPRYTVRYENGSWVFYLGCYTLVNCMFVVYKTRPFKLSSRHDAIVKKMELCNKYFCNVEFLQSV